MTVPTRFRRSSEIHGILMLHYGDLPESDIQSGPGYKYTRPLRTIVDLIEVGTVEKNIAGLPPDIEVESGWNACVASMARPATQERIKELIGRGLCKPGDAENRLGDFVGQLGR